MYRARRRHWFRIQVAPTAEVTVDCLKLVLALLQELCTDGIRAEELAFAKKYIAGSFVLSQQTPRQRARIAMQHQLLGLPADYLRTLVAQVADLSLEQVNRAVETDFRSDGVCVVIVATAAKLVPELTAAGLNVTQVLDFESY
jgi:predicted Zn-dependent peptidase